MLKITRSLLPFNLSEGILTLAKGTSFSLLGEIFHAILFYVYGILIARFFDASHFGIFFLGITIFNLVALLSVCGIEDGLMRYLGIYIQNKEIHKAKGLIRFSLVIAISMGVVGGILCFLLSDLIAAKIFGKVELGRVLRYLSLGIPISSILTAAVASIRGFKNVVPYVLVRRIFPTALSLILTFFVIAMGYGLGGLSMAFIIALIFSAALGLLVLRSFLSQFKKESSSPPISDGYFGFVSTAFLVNVFIFLFNWSDLIILGIFTSSKELGIYVASKKTALILSFLLTSLNAIFIPVISHLHSSDQHSQLNLSYKTATQWVLMLGLPIFIMMAIFSQEFLSLFGPVYQTGKACLIVLAIGHFVNISVGSVGYLLMMTGHQKWMIFNAILFGILTVPITIILVPQYGILGAAYAQASAIIICNLLTLAEVHFLLRLHPFNRRYLKILLSGVVTAAFGYLIIQRYLPNHGSLFIWLGQTSLIFILFFALVILLGLDESERSILIMLKERLLPTDVEESKKYRKMISSSDLIRWVKGIGR